MMNIRLICVGKIKEKYLEDAISEYVKRLSNDLKHRKGMSVSNLNYMAQFAKSFTRDEISHQLGGQIPWISLIEVMSKCKTKESRLWYIEKTYLLISY